MAFTVRPFKFPEDYETASRWWQFHSWPPVPREMLSETGIIVEDSCFLYAAAWVYTTNSKTGLLEHLVSNPYTPIKRRYQAIEFLIEAGVKSLNEMGYPIVIGWLESTGLMRIYERCGFKKGDSALTTMVKLKVK